MGFYENLFVIDICANLIQKESTVTKLVTSSKTKKNTKNIGKKWLKKTKRIVKQNRENSVTNLNKLVLA